MCDCRSTVLAVMLDVRSFTDLVDAFADAVYNQNGVPWFVKELFLWLLVAFQAVLITTMIYAGERLRELLAFSNASAQQAVFEVCICPYKLLCLASLVHAQAMC